MAAAAKTISLKEVAGLDDRIADAFETSMTSEALKALIDEVEKTNADAQAESKAASTRALDPKLRPADVAAARQQMQDADFRSKRMDAASEQLNDLLDKIKRQEAAKARAAEYDAAKEERDQLVKDLAAYDAHAAAIVKLMDRLVRSNARIAKANAGHGAETWLHSAQDIARRAQHAFGVHHDSMQPDFVTGIRLPKFYRDNTNIHAMLWPPASSY